MSRAGRKGVVELAAKGGAYGRQAMWEAMRALRRFTLADLDHLNVERDTIKTYVRSLVQGGYLNAERQAGTGGRYAPAAYELVRDVGLEAPRLRRNGTPVLQGQAREQMWRAMKMLGQFTPRDLSVTASTEAVAVNEEDAKSYVKHLFAAGYLAVLRPGKPPRTQGLYRLAKNTGPKPPMVTRAKVVFDPNLGRIAWHAEIDA